MERRHIVEAEPPAPRGDQDSYALSERAIVDHLEKFWLASDNQDRTIAYCSPSGGCSVYCYAPSHILGRDFWTCITIGLSGTKMNVPADIPDREHFAYAELVCYLPSDWPLPASLAGPPTEYSWPIEMLLSVAKYVRATQAWVSCLHGLPNLSSHPAGQPFHSSTKLSHMILLLPGLESKELVSTQVPDQSGISTNVNFFAVVPLTASEAKWKRDSGFHLSLAFVVRAKSDSPKELVSIDFVIDPHRPCVVDDLGLREEVESLLSAQHTFSLDSEQDDENSGPRSSWSDAFAGISHSTNSRAEDTENWDILSDEDAGGEEEEGEGEGDKLQAHSRSHDKSRECAGHDRWAS